MSAVSFALLSMLVSAVAANGIIEWYFKGSLFMVIRQMFANMKKESELIAQQWTGPKFLVTTWLGSLMTCAFCLSVWAGALMFVLCYVYWPAVAALASIRLSQILHDVLRPISRSPLQEEKYVDLDDDTILESEMPRENDDAEEQTGDFSTGSVVDES